MTELLLEQSDLRTMLWHLATYGLGAILEEQGTAVTLKWQTGMASKAEVTASQLTPLEMATTVRDHAARHSDPESWVRRDITLKGSPRALMSPRLSVFESDAVWDDVTTARHTEINQLTTARQWLDLRLIGSLGEPSYWSRNRTGDRLQDDGASRLEMQPRNQGSEFVGSRLRKLAGAVAAREPAAVLAGLTGQQPVDEIAGRDTVSSRTPTGFAQPGPADNAIAWCALWGISQFPLVPRVDLTGRRGGTSKTAGHLGRGQTEWFHLPVWTAARRPAWLRSIVASQALSVASRANLEGQWAVADTDLMSARSWLSERGVDGVVRFRIDRFGSTSAPERRAMLGDLLPVTMS